MAKPDQIQDEQMRQEMLAARQAMRAGEQAQAVRHCVNAYSRFLADHPETLAQPIGPQNRFAPLMWPRLGANLNVVEGRPDFEWHRERFTLSEAATYYEFTVDSLVHNGA